MNDPHRLTEGEHPADLVLNLRLGDAFAGKFRRLASLTNALIQRATGQTDVSGLQWGILAVLYRDGPSRQRHVAQALHIDRSTMQEIVYRLVDRGYVVSEEFPEDRRAKQLRLTASGVETMLRLTPGIISVQSMLIDDISAERATIAMDVMDQILNKYEY